MDEHFLFSSPQILPFLLSFRKGVFVYTPVLLFAVAGLIVFYRKHKAFFWSTVLLMSVTIYLLSSWWAWSYGICWGMRPMIDYYALLAFPMAAGIQFFFERSRMMKMFISLIIVLMICLNLFQTYQYKNGAIHYDDMSREAYFKGFFQVKPTPEWADLLKPYDWDRRIAGLDQVEYSPEFFRENKHDFYLRGGNLMYVAVNEKAQNAMGTLSKEPNISGSFRAEKKQGDVFTISSGKGLLWSLKPAYQNVITASGMNVSPAETFTVEFLSENDNRIAIKASNGKYISIGTQWPFILKADADKVGRNEIFRYFVIGK